MLFEYGIPTRVDHDEARTSRKSEKQVLICRPQVTNMSDGAYDIEDLEFRQCRQTLPGDGKVFPRHQLEGLWYGVAARRTFGVQSPSRAHYLRLVDARTALPPEYFVSPRGILYRPVYVSPIRHTKYTDTVALGIAWPLRIARTNVY